MRRQADDHPASLLDQHKPENLRAFCRAKVRRWTDNCLTVYMSWGYGMPIKCEVHEIEPEGEDLLYQNQYRLNLTTARYDLYRMPSPPIGIMLLDVLLWRWKLDKYLDNLVQTEFEGFPGTCFRGSDCAVQKDLLYLIHAYHRESRHNVSHSCRIDTFLTDSICIAFTMVMFEAHRYHLHNESFIDTTGEYPGGR